MATVPVSNTKYAHNEHVSIAYQIVGDGPTDVVFIPGFISHVELNWEMPFYRRMLERLGRSCRVVVMDKRGTGLSDRSLGLATLEERMEDVRAVMDAADVAHAALFGVSEGAPMSLLMAATHPDRVRALAIYGGFARFPRAPDYPEGVVADDMERWFSYIERVWGSGDVLDVFLGVPPENPSEATEILARVERYSCTPAVAAEIQRRNFQMDVRAILSAVEVPTLVVHSRGDRVVPVQLGRYLGANLPNARFVELDGSFHGSWLDSEVDLLVDPVEEFLTGAPPVPVPQSGTLLATVLFTDIVQSTQRAAVLGDRRWRSLLDRHDAVIRQELTRHRGRDIDTAGDGFFAVVDGPIRAIRCARAIIERTKELGLSVRVGIHTGECEQRGDQLAGLAVHIGARIAALAKGDEVLVSGTVRDLVVGSGITFEDRGRRTLKGVPGKWQVLAVCSSS